MTGNIPSALYECGIAIFLSLFCLYVERITELFFETKIILLSVTPTLPASLQLPFPSLLLIDGFFSQFFLSVIEPWELTTSCHSVYPWMLNVVKFLFHQIAVSKRRVRLSSEITFAVTPRRRSMPAPIAVHCSQRPLSSRITNTASQSAVCSHAFLRFSGFSFFVCIILAFWWSPVGALC